MNASRFDAAARSLATPMSRRRALGLLAGAVAVGSGLRPRAAQAQCPSCPPAGNAAATKKCEAPRRAGFACAAFVCVEPAAPCCSSTTCAHACQRWQKCRGAGSASAICDDTAKLCSDPTVAQGGFPTFCSAEVETDDSFCSAAGTRTQGWCCQDGEKCGEEPGSCVCDGDFCGQTCCEEGLECKNAAQGLCCPKAWKVCQAGPRAPAKCCPPSDTCCFDRTTKQPECCNSPNQTCGKRGSCVCKKGIRCRSDCCDKKTQVCSRGRCCPKGKVSCDGKTCCKNGRCCGKECCKADETCSKNVGCLPDDLSELPRRRPRRA
jgi:hypothetical protein